MAFACMQNKAGTIVTGYANVEGITMDGSEPPPPPSLLESDVLQHA